MKTKKAAPDLLSGDILYKGHSIRTQWSGVLCNVYVDGKLIHGMFDRQEAIKLAQERIDNNEIGRKR